jgi:hypothetical protein
MANNRRSSTSTATATRKPPARKRAPKKADDKAITVKLRVVAETTNTYKFEYDGTAAEPFVKAFYVTHAAASLAKDKPLTLGFVPYVQTGKKAAQTASTIRFSGADTEMARDLYVNRAAAEKAGFTNDSTVKVVMSVMKDEEHITLAITAA